jgi:hypothetical protein
MRDVEASVWVPYTDNGKPQALETMYLDQFADSALDVPLRLQYEQPSNERSVYKCLCELSELVHESLYLLHSPGKCLTAQDLLGVYTRYLNWYNGQPEVLRLGHNSTPAVLFTQ